MDDCVPAVVAAVEAYRHRKHRIKNIEQLPLVLGLLQEENAIMSREHNPSLWNVPYSSYVFGKQSQVN